MLLPVGKTPASNTGLSGTNLNFYRPGIDPYGYFGVMGARLLAPGQLYIEINTNLALNHMFEIAVNGVPIDLVDSVGTVHWVSALGINDWANLGMDIPFHYYAREANFNTLTPFTTASLGDLRLLLKFQIWRDLEGGLLPGLALVTGTSIPTGAEAKFLGTSHAVPEATLVAEKRFKHLEAAVNIGARFPQRKTVLGVSFNDEIAYGAALAVPLLFFDPLLSLVAETRGHFQTSGPKIVTAPVEFEIGVKKTFKNGLVAKAGGGGAWNNAIGNPRFRGIASLGYTGVLSKRYGAEDLGRDIATIVYFPLNSTRLKSEYREWIRELAGRLKKNPKIGPVLIEGHADDTGSREKNRRLSVKRAEAVRRLLLKEGIAPQRLNIQAHGSEQPTAPHSLPWGRRLNRRVEIRIPKQG